VGWSGDGGCETLNFCAQIHGCFLSSGNVRGGPEGEVDVQLLELERRA